MRILIFFPCLVISLTALCQTQPKLKNVKKTPESNKNSSVSSRPLPTKAMSKNAKRYKKLTVSKPTDHLLDLKHEPE